MINQEFVATKVVHWNPKLRVGTDTAVVRDVFNDGEFHWIVSLVKCSVCCEQSAAEVELPNGVGLIICFSCSEVLFLHGRDSDDDDCKQLINLGARKCL